MRIQRLIGLICVLADVDKITVQELADRFEVSKRTIFRDLDTLNLAGIPIISYPGIGGGISVIEGYKIDLLGYNEQSSDQRVGTVQV